MSGPGTELNETVLLQKAMAACVRAQAHARKEDRVWLAMAAALLRCDLAERRAPGVARSSSSAPEPGPPDRLAL